MNTNAELKKEPTHLRRKWARSLWFRISLVMALIFVLSWFSYWIPRRSVWAVLRVNGLVESQHPSEILKAVRRTPFVGRYFLRDDDVNYVQLFGTAVDDNWIACLRRFTNLEIASFDGGQIGPGLKEIADLPHLQRVTVIGRQMTITRTGMLSSWIDHVDSTITGSHFLLLPQLEVLHLHEFKKGTISELSELKRHPTLRHISFTKVQNLANVLGQLVDCHNIYSITLNLTETDDELLKAITQLPHLKTLGIRSKNTSESFEHRLQEALQGTEIIWKR